MYYMILYYTRQTPRRGGKTIAMRKTKKEATGCLNAPRVKDGVTEN